MKKLLLPLICILFLTILRADDTFFTATILNHPIGIFDTLTVSGQTNLVRAEIGARPRSGGTIAPGDETPVMQTQLLRVWGSVVLAGPPGYGTPNEWSVNGTLQFGPNPEMGSDSSVHLGNVYVHGTPTQKNYMSAGGLLSDTASPITLSAKWVEALGDIKIFSSGTAEFTVPSRADDDSDTHVFAKELCFGNADNCLPNRCVSPNCAGESIDGSIMSWDQVYTTPGKEYGPWTSTSAGIAVCSGTDNDPCVNPANQGHTCEQTHPLSEEDNFSGEGGVYISRILGRKECGYNGNICVFGLCPRQPNGQLVDPSCTNGSYSFDISTAGMSFNTRTTNGLDFDIYGGLKVSTRPAVCPQNVANEYSSQYASQNVSYPLTDSGWDGGNRGAICNELCGNVECDEALSCMITDEDNDHVNSATSDQYGVSPGSCGDKTAWPEGTGLECPNAWDEKWFTVITCGEGSGKRLLPSGARSRYRTVKCPSGTPNTQSFNNNYYLTLNDGEI